MAARKRQHSAPARAAGAGSLPTADTPAAAVDGEDQAPAVDTATAPQTTDYTRAGGHRLTDYGWVIDEGGD